MKLTLDVMEKMDNANHRIVLGHILTFFFINTIFLSHFTGIIFLPNILM